MPAAGWGERMGSGAPLLLQLQALHSALPCCPCASLTFPRLQIPVDIHPATGRSALETVLTVRKHSATPGALLSSPACAVLPLAGLWKPLLLLLLPLLLLLVLLLLLPLLLLLVLLLLLPLLLLLVLLLLLPLLLLLVLLLLLPLLLLLVLLLLLPLLLLVVLLLLLPLLLLLLSKLASVCSSVGAPRWGKVWRRSSGYRVSGASTAWGCQL